MRISIRELTEGVEIIDSNVNFDKPVGAPKSHSKAVDKGDVYVALCGNKDGHDYCDEAIKNGASFIVVEKDGYGCQYVKVKNTRKALAIMAANYYENVHSKMRFVGIVGTNGKTTCTYLINSLLTAKGIKTAIIGTLGLVINGEKRASLLTTPDPLDLHENIAEAYAHGVECIIMEISAHAIYYQKVYGICFDMCVFTNLTQDHLDFFGDMERYSAVKCGFFTKDNMKTAIINVDDAYGRKIIRATDVQNYSYGINNPAEVFAIDVKQENAEMSFYVNAFDDVGTIRLPLLGYFNVYNALAGIAVGRCFGMDVSEISLALEGLSEIEGRFNILKSDITVIIDYAHTPDGLENLLKSVRQLDGKHIIAVFGCGGNRDRDKRPMMGQIASMYCDNVVLTNDNPRFEDAGNIINDVKSGFAIGFHRYTCIKDRKTAIAYAIKHAQSGDIVVIAGKGGEDYIDVLGKKIPYSDRATAEAALRRYRGE